MQENIMLLEKDIFSSKQKDVATISHKHFASFADSLNLFFSPEGTSRSAGNDTIHSIIKNFAFHRSIMGIKKNSKLKANFRLTMYLQRP